MMEAIGGMNRSLLGVQWGCFVAEKILDQRHIKSDVAAVESDPMHTLLETGRGTVQP